MHDSTSFTHIQDLNTPGLIFNVARFIINLNDFEIKMICKVTSNSTFQVTALE